MDQNISIEEVLNNSFATIYDVLKLIDSNINDIVISKLNNNAPEDEILRLKQFNEDYIKAMQKTKSLQSDIVELFGYTNKDINQIKQEEMQAENVVEDVQQMGEMVSPEVVDQTQMVNPEEMMNDFAPAMDVDQVVDGMEQPVADETMDMINSEEVTMPDMAVDNMEDVSMDENIVDEGVTAEEIAGDVSEEATAEEIAGEVSEEVPTEEVAGDVSEEVPTEEIAGEVSEETPTEEVAGEVSEEAPTEEVAGEVSEEAPTEEVAGEVSEETPTEEVAGEVSEETPTGEITGEVSEETPTEEITGEVSEEATTTEENPEITFNGADNTQENDGVVLPTISLNQTEENTEDAPVNEESAPVESVENNTESDLLTITRTSSDAPRVILVTTPQFDKLKQSLETKKALLNAKGMFTDDENLEQQLVQNGLLEGTVEDKQQQIQQLIAEAQELYKEGKNEEAQEKMNLVSQLNEQIKGESQQENVMAA